MSLPSFKDFYYAIKNIEECISLSNNDLDKFFTLVEERGLNLETVMTSDLAQMTLPIGRMRRRFPTTLSTNIYEVAPEGEKAERFIQKNKSAFKKRYGDNWEEILYATAWKLFGKKE